MRTEYLEPESPSLGSFVGSAVTGLYAWNLAEMAGDFSRTGSKTYGQFYVPWSGAFNKKRGPRLAMRTLGAGGPLGVTDAQMQTGMFRATAGTMFKSGSRAAMAQVAVSKISRTGLGIMAWTDPVFFALKYMKNPLMLGVGALWFAGPGLLREAARQSEANRYVEMGGNFMDSQTAVTSRQRAVRAISESHLQARSAIGNEAMHMHR